MVLISRIQSEEDGRKGAQEWQEGLSDYGGRDLSCQSAKILETGENIIIRELQETNQRPLPTWLSLFLFFVSPTSRVELIRKICPIYFSMK